MRAAGARGALCVCLALLALGAGAEAARGSEEFAVIDGRDVTVFHEPSLESMARRLVEAYPRILENVEKALGWRLGPRPVVALAGREETFREMGGGPFFAAFAIPSQSFVAVHCSPLNSNPYLLQEIVEHELCHLVLHDHIRDVPFPLWLEEGICQWVSGNLGEVLVAWQPPGGSGLPRRTIPLRRLSSSFPSSEEELFLAYDVSREFVEDFIDRYGREGLRRVLAAMKEGRAAEDAFEDETGRGIEELEAQWLRGMNRFRRWALWLAASLYEILFFLGGVLLAVAFVAKTLRKRRYAEEEEED